MFHALKWKITLDSIYVKRKAEMLNLNVGTSQENDQHEARSLLELEKFLLKSFQQKHF
jgi:hypothetical protein